MNLLRFVWWMIVHPREAEKTIIEAGDWAARIKSVLPGSRGFTLIELLIVLAILGILIGVIAMGAGVRPMMVGG